MIVMKISISDEIYEKIKKRVKDTDFKSVEEYVNFVLQEVISEVEKEPVLSKEEKEEVKGRLRALGYLE